MLETIDTFARELDNQRRHDNGSAKNGEWVSHCRRIDKPVVRGWACGLRLPVICYVRRSDGVAK